jgi:hypothetical protein
MSSCVGGKHASHARKTLTVLWELGQCILAAGRAHLGVTGRHGGDVPSVRDAALEQVDVVLASLPAPWQCRAFSSSMLCDHA